MAKVTRRRAALGAAGLLLWRSARAQGGAQPLRIGVLGDFSGPYSAIAGEGTAVAARLAVADLGSTVLGRPVEVASADHGNKAETRTPPPTRPSVRVKKPSESKGRWDCLEVIGAAPADEGSRPLAGSACPFVRA